MRPFDERRVLLVVSGGIAAYKSAILLRRLVTSGARVDVVLTAAARRMVGETTFETLSRRSVHFDLWERPLAHVELGRDVDLVVVAPATAHLLARMALGLADDLASSTLLAAAAPILVVPAMNLRMWEHPATQQHLETLRARGVEVVGPATGELAEGEEGPGRMVEPEVILAHVARRLEKGSVLSGRRVVVTAGSTRATLDPVRYIGNRSSGRMAFEIAASAWRRGAEVVLIAGATTEPPPYGPRLVRVESAKEMLEALGTELGEADVLVAAAAVTDFAVAEPSPRKIEKETAGKLELQLMRGPDLLAETRELRSRRGVFTLGFALESPGRRSVERARRKLAEKEMDLIALNEIGEGTGMEAGTNRVTILDGEDVVEEIPLLPKREVADRILDRVESRLRG